MFRGRLDPEVTRRAAARPLLLDVGERSPLRIDGEQHHAVVPAIGNVEVSSRRVDADLRPGVRAVEILRQRRHGLRVFQAAGVRIVRIRRHRRAQLVDDVGEAAVRSEDHVPRTGARPGRHERWVVWSQLPLPSVEPVTQDLVQTQIARERKTIGGIKGHAVRVGTFLTIGMDAFARVLDGRRGGAEPPVGPNRQHGHAAAAVVRHQDVPVSFVEDEVARSRAH